MAKPKIKPKKPYQQRVMRRFTPEDDALIKADYAAYVPTLVMAHKLNRTEGVLRQRIYALGLRRNQAISIAMRFAPDELKGKLAELGDEAFLEAVYEHRFREQEAKQQASHADDAAERKRLDALIDEILEDAGLKRKDKMIAMRAGGVTLEAVGRLFGITRERVRQITSPHYVGYLTKGGKRGRPPKPAIAELERLKNRAEWLDKQAKVVNVRRQQIAAAQLDRLLHTWNNTPLSIRQEFLKRVGIQPAVSIRPVRVDEEDIE